mmetsp:Transcript_18240/g.57363  ORF Transcript_18240/g.57363 Transcript_18240/m.57363 type:complete len:202 (+) Transcript_18240:463-1068(+)
MLGGSETRKPVGRRRTKSLSFEEVGVDLSGREVVGWRSGGDPVEEGSFSGARVDGREGFDAAVGGFWVEDGADALDKGEPGVVAVVSVEVGVEEANVLGDEVVGGEDELGDGGDGEDLDAVREGCRGAEPGGRAGGEGAEDADHLVASEWFGVDGCVLGHVVVGLGGLDLHGEEDAVPVGELDVAVGEAEEVGSVVGVDGL